MESNCSTKEEINNGNECNDKKDKINERKKEVFIEVECNISNDVIEKNEHKVEKFLKVNISDYSKKPAEESDYIRKKDINVLSCAKGDIKNKKKITIIC